MLIAWNRAINLTAIRDPAEIARAHVLDSLTGLAPLRSRGVDRFVDLGSGGGFPGIPLALALPAARALLIDSVGKKIRFLSTVIAAVGADELLEASSARAEALATDPQHRERWPAVTARAVASVAELVELAFPLLATGGILVAWKRGDVGDELRAADRAVRALGGGAIESIDTAVPSLPGHRLVVVTKRGRTAATWPRDPAARRRAPW